MDKTEKQKLIGELKDFHKKLRSYQNRQYRKSDVVFSYAQDSSLNALRSELQRDYGRLSDVFCEYDGAAIIPHSEDSRIIFSAALDSLNMNAAAFQGLDIAINIVNTAIGKLESTPLVSNKLKKPSITQEQKKTYQVPGSFFDRMQFHSRVIEVSRSFYISGHHSQSIFEAFKAVNNYVKDKTGLTLDGTNLMEKVFNENKPILKLNELLTPSDKNEQKGFKYIFMGCQMGIRNPKAHENTKHENTKQEDPTRTLEYLAIASLLMKRIDESKLVKLNIEESIS